MGTNHFALFALCAVSLPAVTLVRDGKTAYSICISPRSTPAERHAADELRRFIEQMSGARLPVAEQCAAGKPSVFVGGSTESFGAEEYVLKTNGRNLTIAGGRPRGTLYGVYALLDKLGCRWFTPEVSRIPKRSTIDVGTLNERGKPFFEYREPYFTEAFDRDWSARNRMNGNSARLDEATGGRIEYFPFVHSFYSLIPPEKYFKDHPEYFSMIDGARRVERGQLCLTNPDVLRIAVAQVRQWIREHPNAGIISVSQNDWEGWCECDRCRRVEEEEGGQHSGPILRFVNAVAEQIEKTNPDKLIDTLAYWYTENPPAKVRPRPNVRIRLCPIGVCESHPYESCPRSRYFVNNLKAWARITNQLYIWHYNTNFAHYLAPFPDFDELAANIPLYSRSGVVGVFLEGAYPQGGGGENAELRSYVMARQLWDPRTDVDREVNDFMATVYGAAAKPMREYFDLLHREVRPAPRGLGQHIWIFNLPVFSRGFLPEANRIFDRALAAADGPEVRRRIEKARLPLEYVALTEAREYRLVGDTYAPADIAGWQSKFAEFVSKLRSFGMTSIREGRPLTEDEKTAKAMRAYSVMPLENDEWRVTIAPDLGGRIIRITDKRSGRELLRAPQSSEGGYPNLGGEAVLASADYPLRGWDITWKQAQMSAREAVLEGHCSNGLRLERRIRLDSDGVHSEVSAANPGSESMDVVLQVRADFEPGDIDSARVRWRGVDGRTVDKPVLNPEEQPNGSETLKGPALPDGEWTLVTGGRGSVAGRFARDLTERATLSWTAKGGPRVSLGVWSAKKRLANGDRMRLEAVYR